MKKINILQLITGLGMGGAEKVVLDLSKNINKIKFSNHVIGIAKRNELLPLFFEGKIFAKSLNKDNNLKDFCLMIKEVNSYVKENNINIIHAHLAHALIVASLVKIFNPSLKIVFTSHSLNIGSKLIEFLIFILKPLRNIDIIFSKDLLKYFYKANYTILPNGVDIKKYDLDLPKNSKFTFIAIGRLETVKNHKLLIEIANNLKDKYDFTIKIVGEGYLRKELEEKIQEFGLEEKVKLLGMKNNIPELLNKSHCLLMPSLWEGLPMVILEAASSKVPIISTSVGSIPSILNIGNSYLTDLNQFENKMKIVLDNYEEANRKAEILFDDIVSKYSIQSIVKEHEAIYSKLM